MYLLLLWKYEQNLSKHRQTKSQHKLGRGAQIPYHWEYVAIWKPIVCRHMCMQCMFMYMFAHICIVVCVHICPYMCFYLSVEIWNLSLPFAIYFFKICLHFPLRDFYLWLKIDTFSYSIYWFWIPLV